MTLNEIHALFLSKVAVIAALRPTYRQPGDGSDGTCDCIGLIIGAVRRMGLKWTGIHGTNWAARREMSDLQPLKSASQLWEGAVVLKSRAPGHSRYKLPARYKTGKTYYNGDLTDYYHAGVVTSLSPLTITHMSSGGITRAHKLDGWTHVGHLDLLMKAAGLPVTVSQQQGTVSQQKGSAGASAVSGSSAGSVQLGAAGIPAGSAQTGVAGNSAASGAVSTTGKSVDSKAGAAASLPPLPSSGVTAKVTASSGRFVKMRQQPSQKCRLYDEVPIGATVTILSPGETWARVFYGRRQGWYMMARYLEIVS